MDYQIPLHTPLHNYTLKQAVEAYDRGVFKDRFVLNSAIMRHGVTAAIDAGLLELVVDRDPMEYNSLHRWAIATGHEPIEYPHITGTQEQHYGPYNSFEFTLNYAYIGLGNVLRRRLDEYLGFSPLDRDYSAETSLDEWEPVAQAMQSNGHLWYRPGTLKINGRQIQVFAYRIVEALPYQRASDELAVGMLQSLLDGQVLEYRLDYTATDRRRLYARMGGLLDVNRRDSLRWVRELSGASEAQVEAAFTAMRLRGTK